jgi:hypothetical protein
MMKLNTDQSRPTLLKKTTRLNISLIFSLRMQCSACLRLLCTTECCICRCRLETTGEGDVPVCKGDVAVGTLCNDYNDCSIDDQCVKVDTNITFDTGARCRGELAGNKTCNDYNVCTDDDECVEIPYDDSDFPSFFTCRGTLVEGRACDDYTDCTINDVCQESLYGDYAICVGTPAAGGACTRAVSLTLTPQTSTLTR